MALADCGGEILRYELDGVHWGLEVAEMGGLVDLGERLV